MNVGHTRKSQQNSFYFYLKKEVEHPQETDSIHQEPKSYSADITSQHLKCKQLAGSAEISWALESEMESCPVERKDVFKENVIIPAQIRRHMAGIAFSFIFSFDYDLWDRIIPAAI